MKLITIPAIALTAGLGLTACGSQAAAPHAIAKPKPVVTVTVTAKPAPVKTAHHAPKPVVTAPAPAPSQAAALPTVLTNSGISTTDKAVEPSTISTSADGTGIISGITWSSWTAYSAEGSGSISLDNGVPNMAQGTIVNVPVSIALSAPVSDSFTAMTLADSAGNTNIYSFNGGNGTDGLGVDDPAPAAAPAASSTWSTNCEVLSADQFQLNVTNNTDQGLTPPGWTVLLFSQGAQVGDSDDAGLGPVLGGSNSASPYAGPGQTVSSNVWTLSSVSFTSCEAVPYQS